MSTRDFIPGRNGGRLLPGGKPGNRGGGRKPDVFLRRIKALTLEAADRLHREVALGQVAPKDLSAIIATFGPRHLGPAAGWQVYADLKGVHLLRTPEAPAP